MTNLTARTQENLSLVNITTMTIIISSDQKMILRNQFESFMFIVHHHSTQFNIVVYCMEPLLNYHFVIHISNCK